MDNLTPDQVKQTFSTCYKIYKDNKTNELFKILSSQMFNASEQEFKGIMTDTYNLYTKYKNIWSDIEWADLIAEASNLQKKYDSDFIVAANVAVLNIIETTFKSKRR